MIFSSFYSVLLLESRTILLLGGSYVVVRYFVYVMLVHARVAVV